MRRTACVLLITTALIGCESSPKRSAPPSTSAEPAPGAPVAATPAMPAPTAPATTEPPAQAKAPPAPESKEEVIVKAAPKEPAPETASPPGGLREVFPHVRVDAKAKIVEFDGIVPIDAHDEKMPWVFLEVVACTPDTKEHEALVMTEAKASNVHAAMLLIGLQPGSPGKWTFENKELTSVPPKGDAVRVTLSYKAADGTEKTYTPEEMVISAQTAKHFGAERAGKWVFAGSQIVSRMGKNLYDADGAGTLIGLTTFGSETIAWSEMISPEAAVEEPVWVADARTTPPAGTPITVTIRPSN